MIARRNRVLACSLLMACSLCLTTLCVQADNVSGSGITVTTPSASDIGKKPTKTLVLDYSSTATTILETKNDYVISKDSFVSFVMKTKDSKTINEEKAKVTGYQVKIGTGLHGSVKEAITCIEDASNSSNIILHFSDVFSASYPICTLQGNSDNGEINSNVMSVTLHPSTLDDSLKEYADDKQLVETYVGSTAKAKYDANKVTFAESTNVSSSVLNANTVYVTNGIASANNSIPDTVSEGSAQISHVKVVTTDAAGKETDVTDKCNVLFKPVPCANSKPSRYLLCFNDTYKVYQLTGINSTISDHNYAELKFVASNDANTSSEKYHFTVIDNYPDGKITRIDKECSQGSTYDVTADTQGSRYRVKGTNEYRGTITKDTTIQFEYELANSTSTTSVKLIVIDNYPDGKVTRISENRNVGTKYEYKADTKNGKYKVKGTDSYSGTITKDTTIQFEYELTSSSKYHLTVIDNYPDGKVTRVDEDRNANTSYSYQADTKNDKYKVTNSSVVSGILTSNTTIQFDYVLNDNTVTIRVIDHFGKTLEERSSEQVPKGSSYTYKALTRKGWVAEGSGTQTGTADADTIVNFYYDKDTSGTSTTKDVKDNKSDDTTISANSTSGTVTVNSTAKKNSTENKTTVQPKEPKNGESIAGWFLLFAAGFGFMTLGVIFRRKRI